MRTGVESTWGARKIVRFDGGFDEDSGREYKSIWLKVAACCEENGIDPADLVRAAFSLTSYDKPPFPNMLLSDTYIAACRKQTERRPADLAVALRVGGDQLRLGVAKHIDVATMDATRAVAMALRDESLGMSALFRCGAAEMYGLHDVGELFAARAEAEYMTAPGAYDKAWGEFIPATLRGRPRKSKGSRR